MKINLDLAQEKLGDALTEQTLAREAQEPGDRELRRFLLNDLNGLLSSAGPGAEVQPSLLARPTQLRSHLRASLEIPAQVLARELPTRLSQWLAEEPQPQHPDRPQWVEQGRWLLDQARLNPSNLS
jgi:hypothetical protein